MIPLLLALYLAAESPTPDDAQKKAVSLVAQLGDPSFRRREAAGRELIGLGAEARLALQAGLKSADAEVRSRCKLLLPAAWEADFRLRIDRFRNDPEGKLAHDLPVSLLFLEYGGKKPEVRSQFASMMASRKEAVRLLEMQPTALIGHYEDRLIAIHELDADRITMMRDGSLLSDLRLETEELNFWLIAFADARVRTEPTIFKKSYFANLLKEAGAYRHSKNAATKALLSTTLSAVLSCVMHDGNAEQFATQIFDVAESRELAGMSDAAASLLSAPNPGPNPPIDRAMGFLGLHGQDRHLANLKAYLNDPRPLSVGYFQGCTTQYRDFALGMSLRIRGLNPQDFGFRFATKDGVPKPYSYGFKSEEERAQAFDMYRDWLLK